jgi:hypothetical protein
MLQHIVRKFKNLYTFYLKIINMFTSIVHFIAKLKYPLVYNMYMFLYNEYVLMVNGDIQSRHIQLFVALGLLVDNEDYFHFLFFYGVSF